MHTASTDRAEALSRPARWPYATGGMHGQQAARARSADNTESTSGLGERFRPTAPKERRGSDRGRRAGEPGVSATTQTTIERIRACMPDVLIANELRTAERLVT
jgi:hypothetical protein